MNAVRRSWNSMHRSVRAKSIGGSPWRAGEGAYASPMSTPPAAGAALITLGSPVLDGLAVSKPVLRAVRSVARLGDAGVPGMFSTTCREGDCCAPFRRDMATPLPPGLAAASVYSRSDGIVDW